MGLEVRGSLKEREVKACWCTRSSYSISVFQHTDEAGAPTKYPTFGLAYRRRHQTEEDG